MDPQWAPVRDDPAAKQLWTKVLRPIAEHMQTHVDELTEQIIDRIAVDQADIIEDLAGEPTPEAARAAITQIAQMIEEGSDPHKLALPPEVAKAGRKRARQQVPIGTTMRAFRLSQDALWGFFFEQISSSPVPAAEQAAALQVATRWLFAYLDAGILGTEQVYEQEREAWLRSNAAARAAAIDDILAERERDPQRASQRLRYEVNREHAAVIIWNDAASDSEDEAQQQELTAACNDLAKAVGADSTLAHPAGPAALQGWLSWRRQSGSHTWDLTKIARELDLPGEARVAIGEPGWGLGGFCRSHTEAAHARRVAELAGPRASVLTRYQDIAHAALASVDPVQAASFVNRVLGPLAADDESTYRVAMTLAVYLEENRSPARAAQRLTVHPNTVSYRVNQAEAILGREVDTDAVEVSTALALLPLLSGMTDEA